MDPGLIVASTLLPILLESHIRVAMIQTRQDWCYGRAQIVGNSPGADQTIVSEPLPSYVRCTLALFGCGPDDGRLVLLRQASRYRLAAPARRLIDFRFARARTPPAWMRSHPTSDRDERQVACAHMRSWRRCSTARQRRRLKNRILLYLPAHRPTQPRPATAVRRGTPLNHQLYKW